MEGELDGILKMVRISRGEGSEEETFKVSQRDKCPLPWCHVLTPSTCGTHINQVVATVKTLHNTFSNEVDHVPPATSTQPNRQL